MKNIADVKSEDILTELNNLGYEDDDLKLLDDEDIRPISDNNNEDLSDFYLNYNEEPKKEEKVDLFTEKPAQVPEPRPFDKYVETPRVEKIEEVKQVPKQEDKTTASVDEYLNRPQSNTTLKQPTPAPQVKKYDTIVPNPKPISNVVTPKVSNVEKKVTQSVTDTNDLNQLFNKVSNNVKGASELVSKNAEIKKKIDERFAELKRLQQEHEAAKKKDIAEINAYKDEVYNKLQEKKSEIEKDVKELKNGQEALDKERKEFEAYKASTLANFNKLEKELKESYDSRNKNIEQVELGLVKRKEQLDKEREQIAKEREELANNLVKFNKLVSDFTQDIDNFE